MIHLRGSSRLRFAHRGWPEANDHYRTSSFFWAMYLRFMKRHLETGEQVPGGWFHSGDIGVKYPDGYIELRDRQKDITISGGENISTIEIEHAIGRHPAVLEWTGREKRVN